MSNQPSEFSESGDRMYRHKPREKPFEMVLGDAGHIKLVDNHIAKYVGKPKTVFHEIMSDLVHIDVHLVTPTPNRNFNALVTSGMSARSMKAPEGHEEFSYSELVIYLPANWPLSQEDFKDERNYWPLRLLKTLARMPHEYDTWLGAGHTVHGNKVEPYAPNTQFCCALIAPILLPPKGFSALTVSPEMKIHFYAVVPLYKEEMEMKNKKGVVSLYNLFNRHKISQVLDLKRRNVAS
jgi:Suppressor of fused protein (SUFU)